MSGGDTRDGDTRDGDTRDGDTRDGDTRDGDMRDGDMSGADDRDRRDATSDAHYDWHQDVVDSGTADLLRHALRREAAQVNPSGAGLEAIRNRTTRVSRRPAWLLPVAAAAASVAVIGGIGWAASSGDTGTPFATDAPTGGPSIEPGPTGSPVDPVQPTITPEGTAVALPVYYVGAQPGDGASSPAYKLFREYHPTTVDAAPDLPTRVELALDEMFANNPTDPDYEGGGWPADAAVHFVGVDEASGIITVDLAGVDTSVSTGADGPGAAAVQQLVFTATAAAAYSGFQPTEVDILVDGERVGQLFGTDVSAPLERDIAGFFAPVQILSYGGEDASFGEGDTLPTPVTISGQLLHGEGLAHWEVSDGARVVAQGDIEPVCCSWEPYEIFVGVLPPGSYELTVFGPTASGQAGDSPSDSKAFNVEGPAQ